MIFILMYIWNVIIPIDELLFFRGVGLTPPTSIVHYYIYIYVYIYICIICIIRYTIVVGTLLLDNLDTL